MQAWAAGARRAEPVLPERAKACPNRTPAHGGSNHDPQPPPNPSSTPHLALEHGTGGPNMSRGSPGKTLPGRRAPLYRQRTPLPLSTDWAAPN